MTLRVNHGHHHLKISKMAASKDPVHKSEKKTPSRKEEQGYKQGAEGTKLRNGQVLRMGVG